MNSDNDAFAVKYITNCLATGEIHNNEASIEVLFRSIDGVDLQPKSNIKAAAVEPLNTSETSTGTSHLAELEQLQQSSTDDQTNVQSAPRDTSTSSSKSEAWKHFKKIDNTSARCNICIKSIKHSGNTTNLMQHMRHSHSMHLPLEKRHARQTATASGRAAKRGKFIIDSDSENVDDPSPSGGSSAARITNKIVYMIAADHWPLSIVESRGFRALMKEVVPLYSIPSRKTITKTLELKYEQMRKVYRDRLALQTSITLTCDIWTDTANQSYLGITSHYLTKELSFANSCLGVFPLHERHTANYISEKLESSLASFGIPLSKVTAIVTDRGTNIYKAAVDTFGASKHIPCLAHILSGVVPIAIKTLPSIEKIFFRLKEIVTITKRSVVASDELRRLQICNGKTESTALKLKQDVPTRWNSTFYMIKRFLELRDYVYPVLMKCPSAPEMLTREEIEILQDCVRVMSPIENAIREISGETYSTGSIAIPIFRCMEITLTKCEPTTKPGESFKSAIIAQVQKNFDGIEKTELLAMTTILDPRFKKVHFQSALAAAGAIRKINNELKSDDNSSGLKVTPVSDSKSSTDVDIWQVHDNLITKHLELSGNDSSELNLELRQYLNQPTISRHGNPLEYWSGVKKAFPKLYPLAIKYLNIITTSVPSERLFSKARAIKTERRNRLGGKRLNMLLFLNSMGDKDWDLE
ncbi:E3 SUMO-protein ligase ZBED1-like [Venturia canescens]|uniref:E3 SUMO-protein ligase ZBED1-like n=1 Tax=Venturia canescens TaxID=32260 RepID=UPI001C9D3EE1|nr:E3 SUMO-protein ligase ZBED1-like [Venturia canescens]